MTTVEKVRLRLNIDKIRSCLIKQKDVLEAKIVQIQNEYYVRTVIQNTLSDGKEYNRVRFYNCDGDLIIVDDNEK